MILSTLPTSPSPPTDPVLRGKPKPTSLTVAWACPLALGGAALTQYMCECVRDDFVLLMTVSEPCRVERRLGEDDWVVCGSTNPPDTQCTVTDLVPGRTYHMRVAAVSSAGVRSIVVHCVACTAECGLCMQRSGWSPEVEGYTAPAPPLAPHAPVVSRITARSVRLCQHAQ